MVVVRLQPWTGWWFSWNDIVRICILNISLSWQQIIVLYLNLAVRFKSGIQQYVFNIPPPFTSPHHHPIAHHSTIHRNQWKSTYYFILYQDKLFFVILKNTFFQYKMTFCIHVWMLSVSGMLLFFWFVVMSLISSWDDMDV